MVSIANGILQPLSELLPSDLFPVDLFSLEDSKGSILDRIYVLDSTMTESQVGSLFAATIAFEGEVEIGIPVCPALKLVIGAGIPDYTTVAVRVLLGKEWYIEFDKIKISLRVAPSIMHPVDPAVQYTEIGLETTVRITAKTIDLVKTPALSLPKSYLGDTQIAISTNDIKFDLRRDISIPEVMEAGLGESFMGVYLKNAEIDLPPDLNVPLPSKLTFTDCFIGGGGFTGQVKASWGNGGVPYPSGSLFGFEFELHSVDITLRESAFVEASVGGLLKRIPYFNKPGLVDVSFGTNGSLSVSLAAQQPTGVSTSPDGLLRLEIPAVAQFDVQALAFEHDQTGTCLFASGKFTPLLTIGGQWPSLQLKRLGIDTQGRIIIDGGWVDLPDQYAISFGGFSLELSRIGFGIVEGSVNDRWFGLTGGIRFTEFLPSGISVDGLRVKFGPSYATPSISFEGIGLDFGVPSVFHFVGDVAYHQLSDGSSEFRGAAALELYPLDVSVEVQIVIGHNTAPSFNYAFLFLDAKLTPSGIPIFNTGLSLYGFAGLYAQNMGPQLNTALPQSDQWYQWYKRPQPGVTDLAKWEKKQSEMAIGLGVTLGTADAGFSFNTKALLVLLLPKPVIMIDGKANFLKMPTTQTSGSEGTFRTFALYDSRSGIVELAVDADYWIPVLLNAHADARAHFEMANSDNWFVTMGELEPPERRATAHLFGSILDGWMFLRINPSKLQMGVGLEFHKRFSSGPWWIQVDASASVVAMLAYSPQQFEAMAQLQGSGRAGIKGISFGMSVSVRTDVAAPKPFLIKAKFRACLDPLGCAEFPFEIRDDAKPEIPNPLEAVSIRHPHPLMKSSGPPIQSVWPLDVDSGTRILGVSPDGLIDITFRRQVSNATSSFVSGDAFEDKWHAVGQISGYRYQYRVTAIRLFDEAGGTTSEVAAAPLVATHGAWQRASSINTVLEIGATTPFSGSSNSITNEPCYDPRLTPSPCDPLPPPNTEWICEDVVMPAEQTEGWNSEIRQELGDTSFSYAESTTGKTGERITIVHICREVVVTDGHTRETTAEQQARIQAWIAETSSWSQTRDILQPNHNYRLEIDYTTELRKHNTVVAMTPATSTVQFKTGGPPSEAWALEPYVLWTVPSFAPGATSRRAYRGYDISILFNETYLDVMYITNGDDLELRLVDNNGNPILDTTGKPVVLPNAWSHAPTRVLTREETVLTERLEAGGCLPHIEWSKQPLAMTSPSAVGLLRPETYYEVHVTRKNDATKQVLAHYSFVTSRFATFSDMISSFLPSLALPWDGTGLTIVMLAAADFATIASALEIVPAARPERFTISPLRVAPKQTLGLLINSPEPIEWTRTELTIRAGTPLTSYSGAKLRIIANADETMAFALALDAVKNSVTLPDGPCEMEMKFNRYLSSSVPIYSVQGDSSTEVVTIKFTLGGLP